VRVDLVKQRGVLEKFVLVALFRDVSEWQLRGGVCAGGFLRSECGVGRGVGFGGEKMQAGGNGEARECGVRGSGSAALCDGAADLLVHVRVLH
jgi:hypothetical protein